MSCHWPTGRSRRWSPAGATRRYLASGHLAWVDRRTLFVAPFSLERLQLTGPGVAVIDDIALNMYNSAEFDASQTGTFVCRCGPGGDNSVVQWLDPVDRRLC